MLSKHVAILLPCACTLLFFQLDQVETRFSPAAIRPSMAAQSLLVGLKTGSSWSHKQEADTGTIDPNQDPNPFPTMEELEDTATNEMIDDVLDQIMGENGGIIIHRYLPTRSWLWNQWYATVLFHSTWSAIWNMLGAFAFCVFIRKLTHGDWNIWDLPDSPKDNALIARFLMIEKVWKNLMALTTFLLTFFVGQAFTFWRSVYDMGRSIQGRMNDINLLLATHVSRKKNGSYTSEAESFLQDIASKLRSYHILMWATHARRYRILLTDRGLSRMVTRGILSAKEFETLNMQISIPKTSKHIILLEWVLFKCRQAQKHHLLEGGSGLEYNLLDKICTLQTLSAQVAHKVNGRMPLAYAHFVQILVDSFLFCAPLAQYGELGIFSVVSMGISSLFYLGLLDLAKVFLDPLDNEDYNEGCLHMDLGVFIRESNVASRRWMTAASKFKW